MGTPYSGQYGVGGGGGGGGAPPERGAFFMLEVYKRVNISRVEIQKRAQENLF